MSTQSSPLSSPTLISRSASPSLFDSANNSPRISKDDHDNNNHPLINTDDIYPEILIASAWWTEALRNGAIGLNYLPLIRSADKYLLFYRSLSSLLYYRYSSHWYPSDPSRGSGYRSISYDNRFDRLLKSAGEKIDLKEKESMMIFAHCRFIIMKINPGSVKIVKGGEGGTADAAENNYKFIPPILLYYCNIKDNNNPNKKLYLSFPSEFLPPSLSCPPSDIDDDALPPTHYNKTLANHHVKQQLELKEKEKEKEGVAATGNNNNNHQGQGHGKRHHKASASASEILLHLHSNHHHNNHGHNHSNSHSHLPPHHHNNNSMNNIHNNNNNTNNNNHSHHLPPTHHHHHTSSMNNLPPPPAPPRHHHNNSHHHIPPPHHHHNKHQHTNSMNNSMMINNHTTTPPLPPSHNNNNNNNNVITPLADYKKQRASRITKKFMSQPFINQSTNNNNNNNYSNNNNNNNTSIITINTKPAPSLSSLFNSSSDWNYNSDSGSDTDSPTSASSSSTSSASSSKSSSPSLSPLSLFHHHSSKSPPATPPAIELSPDNTNNNDLINNNNNNNYQYQSKRYLFPMPHEEKSDNNNNNNIKELFSNNNNSINNNNNVWGGSLFSLPSNNYSKSFFPSSFFNQSIDTITECE